MISLYKKGGGNTRKKRTCLIPGTFLTWINRSFKFVYNLSEQKARVVVMPVREGEMSRQGEFMPWR